MSDNARFKIKYTGTVLEVERDFPSGIQSEVGPEVRKPLAGPAEVGKSQFWRLIND